MSRDHSRLISKMTDAIATAIEGYIESERQFTNDPDDTFGIGYAAGEAFGNDIVTPIVKILSMYEGDELPGFLEGAAEAIKKGY